MGDLVSLQVDFPISSLSLSPFEKNVTNKRTTTTTNPPKEEEHCVGHPGKATCEISPKIQMYLPNKKSTATNTTTPPPVEELSPSRHHVGHRNKAACEITPKIQVRFQILELFHHHPQFHVNPP